jgi:hypothetical protein
MISPMQIHCEVFDEFVKPEFVVPVTPAYVVEQNDKDKAWLVEREARNETVHTENK